MKTAGMQHLYTCMYRKSAICRLLVAVWKSGGSDWRREWRNIYSYWKLK